MSNILLGFFAIFTAVYFFALYKFSYWKRRSILQSTPSFPLGNCQGISRTRNLGDIITQTYREGRGSPAIGFFIVFGPNILIRDPKLVRQIINKDFSAFNGRGFKVNTKLDPLTGHLFFLEGPEWRTLRARLTPTFTSGKMKMMFPIIEECCKEMHSYVLSNNKGGSIFEAGELFTKYTTNCITRCAFGLDVDFFKCPDAMFEKMVHRVGNPTRLDAFQRGLSFSLGQYFDKLPLRLVPKELSDYFIDLLQNAINTRNKNKERRNDFLQLLIDLIDKGWLDDVDALPDAQKPKLDHEFTIIEAAAQAFSFVLGGFDTSGTTMQCCLFELANNPNVQQKVREEILDVSSRYNNKITYESLHDMVYLEQVISETLRLHPAVPFLSRECKRPYQLTGTDILLEPGMKIWISTAGLQTDPDFFPNPELFDPERFSPKNKQNIVPFTFLPFGEGPRTCIGNRFAMMQMKAGIASLLSSFSILKCEETPAPPLKLDPKKALTLVLGGVPLRILPL